MNVTDVIDTVENENSDFRILTADKSLQELFSGLYSLEIVIKLPRLFANFRPAINFLRDFSKLLSYKQQVLNKCKQFEPEKIIFYYMGWNGFESWIIKELSKTTKVYYRPKVDIGLLKDNSSFILSIKTFILSSIYGIKFKAGLWYGYPVITIDESFLKLVHAQKYSHAFNFQNIKNFMCNKFAQTNDVECLLLVGGEYNLDRNEYKTIMSNLYSILTIYYKPSKMGIKNHPLFPVVKFGWEDDCVVFDEKTPANLLCYTAKVVIAYGSSVLYEAADIGIRAISTAYIIPSTLDGQCDNTAQYLLDNSKSKKISFPRNIDEFSNLFVTQTQIGA
jgi:hypothetical protein